MCQCNGFSCFRSRVRSLVIFGIVTIKDVVDYYNLFEFDKGFALCELGKESNSLGVSTMFDSYREGMRLRMFYFGSKDPGTMRL